ncbi:hypothetical protein M0R72_01295 [Candidatus Pacearchaeota archaeon]|nr:hypothetical protein [Candidatus Pacearchaeota archaeon]
MTDSELPTNPNGPMISQDDVLAYLVGAMQRIESQLASNEPPPWAIKLYETSLKKIEALEKRTEVLDVEIQKIKMACSARHSNGNQLKLPLV